MKDGESHQQRARTPLVKESTKANITYDAEDNKMVNSYRMISELGKGAFGKVKLVLNQEDGKHYVYKLLTKAMKIQSKKKMKVKALRSGKNKSFNMFQQEIAIMKKIDSPNLVRLHEVIDDKSSDKMYLIIDYMDLGYLGSSQHRASQMIRTNCIPLEKLWVYFRECVKGLDYRRIIFNRRSP